PRQVLRQVTPDVGPDLLEEIAERMVRCGADALAEIDVVEPRTQRLDLAAQLIHRVSCPSPFDDRIHLIPLANTNVLALRTPPPRRGAISIPGPAPARVMCEAPRTSNDSTPRGRDALPRSTSGPGEPRAPRTLSPDRTASAANRDHPSVPVRCDPAPLPARPGSPFPARPAAAVACPGWAPAQSP